MCQPVADDRDASGRRSLSLAVQELTHAEWNRRPLRKRYIDNVMRFDFSALQQLLSPTRPLQAGRTGEQRIEEGADMRNALVCQRQHLNLERLM